MMNKLADLVPNDLRTRNANVEAFINVLDGLKEKRDEQLLLFENMLNPYTAKSPTSVKDFLYEVGDLPRFTDVPMFLVERFILGAEEMFSYVGTKKGLELFAYNAVDGVIENADYSGMMAQQYFKPGNLKWGYLPNSDDLDIAINTPEKYP
jgi:hypothetical protein